MLFNRIIIRCLIIFVNLKLENKLDKNFFGIPKEGYAFSNNVFGALGSPPSFKEYTADGDMTILLKLSELFAPPSESEEEVKQQSKAIKFEYKTFEPGRIKKMLFSTEVRETPNSAKLISQPVYAERRMKVEKACYNAGEQVVKEGKINTEFMQAVSDVEITQKKFQEQADYFWESLDGKASYLKSSPRLEYNNDT